VPASCGVSGDPEPWPFPFLFTHAPPFVPTTSFTLMRFIIFLPICCDDTNFFSVIFFCPTSGHPQILLRLTACLGITGYKDSSHHPFSSLLLSLCVWHSIPKLFFRDVDPLLQSRSLLSTPRVCTQVTVLCARFPFLYSSLRLECLVVHRVKALFYSPHLAPSSPTPPSLLLDGPQELHRKN